MRILFVAENFPLPASEGFEVTGGVEAAVLAAAQSLAERHEVSVITNRRTHDVEYDDFEIIQCGRSGRYAQQGNWAARFSFQHEAVRLGIRCRPNVVVGWNFVAYPAALKIARSESVPGVAYYHDVWVGRWFRLFGFRGLVGECVERRVLRGDWNAFWVNSDWTSGQLIRSGIAPDKIRIIPPIVDCPCVQPEVLPGRNVALVSRLVAYKRVDIAIRAFAKLCAARDDVTLRIVGDGPRHARLSALTGQLGIADRVEWRGYVPAHRDVLALMAGCDVLMSASEVEGFGITNIEAAGQGTPCVAADIPAVRFATRNGMGGRLFPVGDVTACAHALAELLDDPARLEREAHAARELAVHYRADRIGPLFEQALRDVVEAP